MLTTLGIVDHAALTRSMYRLFAECQQFTPTYPNDHLTTVSYFIGRNCTNLAKVRKVVVTSVKNQNTLLNMFSLSQNYPNPFNPTTTIQYSIGTDAHPSNNNMHGRASVPTFTTLKIYDVLGREVATLVNEVKEAGNYSVQWNASKFSRQNAGGLASGIYYARLQSREKVQMKKMLLLR